jgi:mannose-1-phosphate guanylyltransferase
MKKAESPHAGSTPDVFETDHVYPIIMCGGSGTRLWPLSRKDRPKQFLSLDNSGNSLLQRSIERIARMAPPERRWVVTTASQAGLVKEQCAGQIGRILMEPEPKNTAPAVALAASRLMKVDPDSYMVIVSSDHSIQNTRSFEQSVADALALAAHHFFVTIGVEPSFPSTGFGYIECGLPLDENGQILPVRKLQESNADALAYAVRSFREKPNRQAAEQFIRTGKYKWNSGIFVWKTSAFWNAFTHLQPEMAAAFDELNEDNIDQVYGALPSTPIDVAFMEQTSHVACVPARFDWNDVGSWQAVRECFEQDDKGNAFVGPIVELDTTNSVVHSTGPLVATVGLDNMAVVATDDVVLVMPLDRAQDVKKIVDELKRRGKPDIL